jgi:hypothetical protein
MGLSLGRPPVRRAAERGRRRALAAGLTALAAVTLSGCLGRRSATTSPTPDTRTWNGGSVARPWTSSARRGGSTASPV